MKKGFKYLCAALLAVTFCVIPTAVHAKPPKVSVNLNLDCGKIECAKPKRHHRPHCVVPHCYPPYYFAPVQPVHVVPYYYFPPVYYFPY